MLLAWVSGWGVDLWDGRYVYAVLGCEGGLPWDLMMADAVPACDIARTLGVHMRTVEKWRERFSAGATGGSGGGRMVEDLTWSPHSSLVWVSAGLNTSKH